MSACVYIWLDVLSDISTSWQLCRNCLIEVAGISIFSQHVCLVASPGEPLLPAVSSVVLTSGSPGQGFT